MAIVVSRKAGGTGTSWFKRDKTTEELSGVCKTDMDEEMANALMGETGVLGNSLTAAVPLMQTDASDSFVAKFLDGTKATAEQKQRCSGTGHALESEGPDSIIDVMRELMPKISAEAAKAHHYSISLSPHDISDKVVLQMKQHAVWMNAAFKLLQKLIMANVTNEDAYSHLRSEIDARMSWFKARAKTCQNMERELIGTSAKKGKTEEGGWHEGGVEADTTRSPLDGLHCA